MTATEQGRRGPYAKSAERRAALTRAALDIVVEQGHQALTVSEVAARAGISERTLFYHFPTRDHLLVAALELADEDSRAAMEARFTREGVAPREDPPLDEIIEALSTRDYSNPWKVRLMVALNAHAQEPDHPAHDYFRKHNARAIEQFALLVESRQAAGKAHPDLDPARIARRLVAVWDGLQSQWLVSQDFDLAQEIQESFRQLTGQHVMDVRRAIDQVMGLQTAEVRSA